MDAGSVVDHSDMISDAQGEGNPNFASGTTGDVLIHTLRYDEIGHMDSGPGLEMAVRQDGKSPDPHCVKTTTYLSMQTVHILFTFLLGAPKNGSENYWL